MKLNAQRTDRSLDHAALDVIRGWGVQGLDGATGLGISSLAVTVIGVADGCVQGSLFGIAGRMPSQYTQALMIGAACAGLVTSILRALTKVSISAQEPCSLCTAVGCSLVDQAC